MQTADQINLAIAIVSGLSTLMSLAVVITTFKILQANQETVAVMREQARSASRPYIQVQPWIRVGSTMLMLTIRNAGANAAQNLSLKMDKDFYSNGEQSESRNLRRYTAFVHPSESLAPRAEISFHLGAGHIVFSNPDSCPQRFVVTAEYEFAGEKVVESHTIDLQPFLNSAQPIDPVAEQVEKLVEQLIKIEKKVR